MIAQLVLILAAVIAIGLGLAGLWFALSRSINPPPEHVTVPVDDHQEHLPR
jgi:uncharacterized membrane protein YfbV (UPF0208 family)